MVEIPATCLAYDEDLSGLIDGELGEEREAEVRAHLDGCAHCRERLEALRGVDTALRSVAAPAVPSDLRARLAQRLSSRGPAFARLRSAAHAASPRLRRAKSIPRRPRWLAAGVGLAAAAALALYLAVGSVEGPRPGAVRRPETLASRGAAGSVPLPAPPLEVAETPPPVPAEEPSVSAAESFAPAAAESVAIAETPAAEETPPFDLDAISDEELAVVVDLDTYEDLDVIVNLEILERYLAGEAGSG